MPLFLLESNGSGSAAPRLFPVVRGETADYFGRKNNATKRRTGLQIEAGFPAWSARAWGQVVVDTWG